MKVINVTKEYFETEDEKVYFFEPLERKIPKWIMQKVLDDSGLILRFLRNWEDNKNILVNEGDK